MKSGKVQLPLQTLSLVAGFMIWVILSSMMPYIKSDIKLTPSQISLVTAVPVILGSILRVPIGYWTNRFGARILFVISFLVLIPPVYYISMADSLMDLMISGFLIGIGGAVFSVGVTSLPKYYPKEKHGFVNGVYGAGNIGTAVTTFAAPVLADQLGWRKTVLLFIALLAVFVILNLLLGDRKEPKVKTSLKDQMTEVYKNQKLWFLSIFYFLTFGSFVAFTMYLPNFLVTHFHLEKVDAGMRTAGFIVIATLMRPIGGYLADRWNSFKILMAVFAGLTFSGILLAFTPSLFMYSVGSLMISFCAGIGNGAVFKLVPLYFSRQSGIVNGIVSMMGGLGGFFPPLLLTSLYNITGSYSISFMALSEVALACFILAIMLYYQENVQLAKNGSFNSSRDRNK